MRLSSAVAATAAVQLRSANAAKLTLRIIAASLVKHGCGRHRQPGDEGNEAGFGRPLAQRWQAAVREQARSARRQRAAPADNLQNWSRGWQPCSEPGPTSSL